MVSERGSSVKTAASWRCVSGVQSGVQARHVLAASLAAPHRGAASLRPVSRSSSLTLGLRGRSKLGGAARDMPSLPATCSHRRGACLCRLPVAGRRQTGARHGRQAGRLRPRLVHGQIDRLTNGVSGCAVGGWSGVCEPRLRIFRALTVRGAQKNSRSGERMPDQDPPAQRTLRHYPLPEALDDTRGHR